MNPTPITPKRILVMRLDRLGDVILSTPVLEALRQRYPHAFIAMMVRAANQDILHGNPYLNEVIVYEKEGTHHSVWGTIRFARRLRRYAFDTAIVLHPSNRSHWIPWLAHIPVRIGYHRKRSSWLLTHRLPHRKQEGAKPEMVYTLELLEPLGIVPNPALRPHISLQPRAVKYTETLLTEAGISSGDRLVAIHPSASCVSRRWMPDRFAQVADRLITEQGIRICIVAAEADASYAHAMRDAMRQPVLDLTGRLSVAELAALLHRCRLLISNDTGPVHVAAAMGTPVVDIFGRNQRGLSPLRWGPMGEGHIVLHKEVGCVKCLAHNCDINFLCLTEISVDEVYQAAAAALQRTPSTDLKK